MVRLEVGREARKVAEEEAAIVREMSPSSRTVSSMSRGSSASISRSAML